MIVCLTLRDLLKTQPLIKLKCSIVLQADRKYHLLSLLMGSVNEVLQDPTADALALMTWLYLDLPDFHRISSFEQLDHAHTCRIDVDNRDMTAFPALGELSCVSNFVPAAKSRPEQLLVDIPSQTFEPGFVFDQCWN